MGRAECDRIAAAAEILRGLQRGDAERRTKHGDVEMTALTAAGRQSQRGDDGETGIQPRREIRQRHAAFQRRPAGLAGHMHDAAHGLHGQIETTFLGARSALTIGRDRAVDQTRIELTQRGVAETQALHHARAIVLDEHVAVGDQTPDSSDSRRVFQIQRQ